MDSVINKVQKHVDTLKAKNARLAEDNAKLKEQLTSAKQLHSRIRRIAKKGDPAGATPAAAATPAP
jgi:outer membrane murein-binding lipoprotein Lpp